jgi:hypothetical protein
LKTSGFLWSSVAILFSPGGFRFIKPTRFS